MADFGQRAGLANYVSLDQVHGVVKRARWVVNLRQIKGETNTFFLGDIVHIQLMGQHVVIINSAETAAQIMNRAIYSDRPRLVMAGEMYGISPSKYIERLTNLYCRQNGLR